jgi:hypothetical protein
MRPQTRPMPENTVDQIDDGSVNEFADIQEDNPRQDAGGILSKLAEALGISPAKIATVLGSALPGKSKLNATCPKCRNRYKYFSDEAYQEDQSICPACRDEAMRPTREAIMRPEKEKAERLIRLQTESEAKKKSEAQRETIELVAQTVAQVLAENKSKAA